MTLLSISNAVADETNGPRPVTVASNTDPAAQKILRTINKVGIAIMKTFPWEILTKEHTLTAPGTETVIAAASMPSDYDRLIPETFWDRSSNNLISGPISPVEWAGLKVQDTLPIDNKKFRFRGGDLLVLPVLGNTASLAFEYVSGLWCDVAAADTPKAAMTIDTDITIIDEELLIYGTAFQWLASEGQPAGVVGTQFKDHFDTLIRNEDASPDIMIAGDIFGTFSRHFTGAPTGSNLFYGSGT